MLWLGDIKINNQHHRPQERNIQRADDNIKKTEQV
jgi:hypothetical protein